MNGNDMITDILKFFERPTPYDNAKGMSDLVAALGPKYGKRALQEAVRTLVNTGWLQRNDFAEHKTKGSLYQTSKSGIKGMTPAPCSNRAREPPGNSPILRMVLALNERKRAYKRDETTNQTNETNPAPGHKGDQCAHPPSAGCTGDPQLHGCTGE